MVLAATEQCHLSNLRIQCLNIWTVFGIRLCLVAFNSQEIFFPLPNKHTQNGNNWRKQQLYFFFYGLLLHVLLTGKKIIGTNHYKKWRRTMFYIPNNFSYVTNSLCYWLVQNWLVLAGLRQNFLNPRAYRKCKRARNFFCQEQHTVTSHLWS